MDEWERVKRLGQIILVMLAILHFCLPIVQKIIGLLIAFADVQQLWQF